MCERLKGIKIGFSFLLAFHQLGCFSPLSLGWRPAPPAGKCREWLECCCGQSSKVRDFLECDNNFTSRPFESFVESDHFPFRPFERGISELSAATGRSEQCRMSQTDQQVFPYSSYFEGFPYSSYFEVISKSFPYNTTLKQFTLCSATIPYPNTNLKRNLHFLVEP